MRYLRRLEDDELFAYAQNGAFLHRVADGQPWAYETANYLVSARSGRPLAYRVGDTYFDADLHVPLYQETYRSGPPFRDATEEIVARSVS
jgi:hypothetical protein